MKLVKFAELIALFGVAVGCTLMIGASTERFTIGLLLTFGSIAWYAAKGMYRDALGRPSEADLKAQLAAVNEALKANGTLPDLPENRRRKQRLEAERVSLWLSLAQTSPGRTGEFRPGDSVANQTPHPEKKLGRSTSQ
jgi:hypothetical protein